MNFNNGNVNNNNKSNSHYVRAVRSGKCELLSFATVYQAYIDCRRRKRGTINALRFEYDLLENLTQLALDIQQGKYRPSRSVCFITTRPKFREIFAADFRDRIVHHLVVRELEKLWEPKFIHDSYASRKGKGIHSAVKRLQRFMRKATQNMTKPAWFLQLDIRSFFMSIDKHVLFDLLKKDLARHADRGKADGLLYLLHRIIFHDCTKDYSFKGDPVMLGKVPAHKSLFSNPPDRGLPIGNLTSQFLSNVYLNELDQFVKHELKCRFYIRYVDDFVLVSANRGQLSAWRQAIEDFLAKRLMLRLKSPGVVRRIADGVNFLGYIVRPRYILSRRRVVSNLKARLRDFRSAMVFSGVTNDKSFQKYVMTSEMVKSLRQTLSSYIGHFKHADSFNLLQSIWHRHNWLAEYFFLCQDIILDRFRYRGIFHFFKNQLHFFRFRLGPDTAILTRVGKFYEFYDQDALTMGTVLGLSPVSSLRGMSWSAGFPARMLDHYIRQSLKTGKDLAILEEAGPGKFVTQRQIHILYKFGGQHA